MLKLSSRCTSKCSDLIMGQNTTTRSLGVPIWSRHSTSDIMSRHSTSKWCGREEKSPHLRSGSIIDVYHECSKISLEWGSDDCYVSYKPHVFKNIDMKSPCELLLGENKLVVPPKVFGCTCFVRNHRPSVTKLDPRAVKCIFIGYPAGQRGYKGPFGLLPSTTKPKYWRWLGRGCLFGLLRFFGTPSSPALPPSDSTPNCWRKQGGRFGRQFFGQPTIGRANLGTNQTAPKCWSPS